MKDHEEPMMTRIVTVEQPPTRRFRLAPPPRLTRAGKGLYHTYGDRWVITLRTEQVPNSFGATSTRRMGWLLHDNEGTYRDETFMHLRQVRAEIVTRATDRRMLARTIESAARRLADGMYIDDAERAEVANLARMVEKLCGITPGTDRNNLAPMRLYTAG
jgi:hypothetical protein